MPDDKKLKKLVFDSLFGTGSITVAQFRSAFAAVVDNLVRFKDDLLQQVNQKLRQVEDAAPTDAKLLSLIRPLIPEVTDGHTPTEKELLALIKPLIPTVKDGETPSDAKLLRLIRELLPEQKDLLDTGEQIVDKINADKSGKVIQKKHIEGLSTIEDMARTAEANSRSFMNTGSYVYDYDLSALLNGSTKTFTLPVNAKVITILSSSAPVVFRKTTDYTTTASTITFTSAIDATTTLAAGQSVILLYKIL